MDESELLVSCKLEIRAALDGDVPSMRSVYNDTLMNETGLGDPIDLDTMRRFVALHEAARRPVWVAVSRDDANVDSDGIDRTVVAWLSLYGQHDRPGWRHTAEVSVFVRRSHQRRGVGQQLLVHALAQAFKWEIDVLVAWVPCRNSASLTLFRRQEFDTWGCMRDVLTHSPVTAGLAEGHSGNHTGHVGGAPLTLRDDVWVLGRRTMSWQNRR